MVALVRFLFVVDSGVLLQRRVLRKCLVAQVATFGVNPGSPPESLPFKGSVLVVGSLVLLESFFAIEKLVASGDSA